MESERPSHFCDNESVDEEECPQRSRSRSPSHQDRRNKRRSVSLRPRDRRWSRPYKEWPDIRDAKVEEEKQDETYEDQREYEQEEKEPRRNRQQEKRERRRERERQAKEHRRGKVRKWCEKGQCWDHGQVQKPRRGPVPPPGPAPIPKRRLKVEKNSRREERDHHREVWIAEPT